MRNHLSWILTGIVAVSAFGQPGYGPPPGGGRGPGRGPGGPGGGDGIWMRNAVLAESPTFDPCNAHQPPTGEYHYHDNPVCLRLQLQDNIRKIGGRYMEQPAPWHHSPILGWAYDGNPIYGPYGYSNPKDPSSPVVRMQSGFRLRKMSERHSLASWAAALHGVDAQLRESQYGPNVDAEHPLGWYVEDYEFIVGVEELDVYNGRFTVTPEYPKGTYAYFVTIDDKGQPVFPYVLGRQYYGAVPAGVSKVTPGLIEAYPKTGGKSSDPELTSWLTKYNSEDAHVVDGHNADRGPVATWPGQSKPAHPDVSEVLYSKDWVYVSGSGLSSHTMGPWYDPDGSVFNNWPRDQNFQDRFPRQATPATVKTTNMLGPLGRWVNGVALFNMLDGASWSHEQKADVMGGPPGGGRGPGRGGRGGPPRLEDEER